MPDVCYFIGTEHVNRTEIRETYMAVNAAKNDILCNGSDHTCVAARCKQVQVLVYCRR